MNYYLKQIAVALMIMLGLQSCDVDQFIDSNFKEKSLVVVAPDFIKNRVTIVFEDAETGAVIKEDLSVNLFATERLIDLSGHYNNSFTAKNGLLNFALDPNEPLNPGGDQYFTISINHEKNDKFYSLTNHEFYLVNKNIGNSIIRVPVKEIDLNEATTDSKKGHKSEKGSNLKGLENYFITFNGLKFNEFNSRIVSFDYIKDLETLFAWSLRPGDNESYRILNEDLVLKVNAFDNIDWNNLKSYTLSASYILDGESYIMRLTDKGVRFIYKSQSMFFSNDDFNMGGAIVFNFDNSMTVPKGASMNLVQFLYERRKNNLDCTEGFNFNFEGLDPSDTPNLLYKTVRNEGLNSYMGYAQPTNEKPTHNTTAIVGNHIYGKSSNKVVFDQNDQYIIEPQEMELGGEDSCGQTYNFKVYPRDGHNRYTLNLQFQCAGDEFSTAPSLVAFMTEEGVLNNPSLIQFENGSTNLVLKPESKYLVQGSFNETEFGFTFTANEAQIAQSIANTIADNDNIQDIEYTISKINNVESVINAKVIFKSGSCPE